VERQFQRKFHRLAVGFAAAILTALPLNMSAWNIPGQMLSGSIPYADGRR
jgi:hypothetical protein